MSTGPSDDGGAGAEPAPVTPVTGGTSGIGEATARRLVQDGQQVSAAVEEAVVTYGRLDAVVANAGFSAEGTIAEGDPDQWREMVLTNVLGRVAWALDQPSTVDINTIVARPVGQHV